MRGRFALEITVVTSHEKAISRGDAEVAEEDVFLRNYFNSNLVEASKFYDEIFSAFSASPREYGFEFSSG